MPDPPIIITAVCTMRILRELFRDTTLQQRRNAWKSKEHKEVGSCAGADPKTWNLSVSGYIFGIIMLGGRVPWPQSRSSDGLKIGTPCFLTCCPACALHPTLLPTSRRWRKKTWQITSLRLHRQAIQYSSCTQKAAACHPLRTNLAAGLGNAALCRALLKALGGIQRLRIG